MGKFNTIHKARMSRHEYQLLSQAFPAQSDTLRSISYLAGPNVFVNVGELPQATKDQLGPELLDQLFRYAYQVNEKSFSSYLIQLREVISLPKSKVSDILEIGPGKGFFRALIGLYGYRLLTLDLLPENAPDIMCDARSMPVDTDATDLVCAFEVLEHIPYSYFCPIVSEMARVARHYVLISLPYPNNSLYLRMNLRIQQRFFRTLSSDKEILQMLPTKRFRDQNEAALLQRADKTNPHYWEVNRHSYPKARILSDIEKCGLNIVKAFNNPQFSFHYFILCEVRR